MSRIKDPILSVVMPVYNVERYLESAIESVINQTIGFSDNIELILINDGSSDDSDSICQRYEDAFPENIVYIKQTNRGASATRNVGIETARGKYVNFLDSDDIWSEDAYKEAVDFLEIHDDEVDFVASKIKFFEANIDEHPANYKFSSTRVINLTKEPDNPIFHLPTCVFRREALVNKRFNTKLVISEDARILSEILLDKKAYGVLSEPVYNYRKRSDESSAIGGQQKNKDFYTTVPKLAYLYMLDLWRDSDGRVEPFMQYEVLSDLMWRLRQRSQAILSGEEEKEYKELIKGIVSQFDDEVIIKKRGIPLAYRLFILKMKHGSSYDKLMSVDPSNDYIFNGVRMVAARDVAGVTIEFIHHMGDGVYKLEGYESHCRIQKGDCYVFETSLGQYKTKRISRPHRSITFLGDEVYDGGGFEATIRMAPNDTLSTHLSTSGKSIGARIHTDIFSHIGALQNSYHRQDGIILRKEGEIIRSYIDTKYRAFWFELSYCFRILLNWKLRDGRALYARMKRRNLSFLSPKARVLEVSKPFLLVAESMAMIPRSLLLRGLYFAVKPFVRRPIWLVSDRGMAAGDNGEAFFRYVQSRDDVKANVYYVISKKSSDYARVKEYGKVINQNGFYYKLLFLLSSKVISSQADVEITNPFLRQLNHFVDLLEFDFVFLQHGIIRHDLSAWLNRYNKNISLFVTSAKKEYDSIFDYPYGYEAKNVLLSGLPRYDLLESKPAGKLILAPTYRKDLAKMRTDKNGARMHDPSFKNSPYFNFYNDLMNDQRLLDTLKSNGMTGEFYLHPAFAAQTVDFTSNDYFKIQDYPYNYKKAFKEGNLLVSDYSSVMFDFAYLKKPVIYTHFDIDTLFDRHTYDKADFFSDERDGFGLVTYTYETLVDEIIKTVESGCKMQKKYQARVDTFYYKNDKNNSKRVYDAIVKYDRDKQGIV